MRNYRHNLGLLAPSALVQRVIPPTRTTSATVTAPPPRAHSSMFAAQPKRAIPARRIAPGPTKQMTPVRIPTSTGPVTIRREALPGVQMPESFIAPEPFDTTDQFRFSDDQIRDMLMRGKSETMERSGESDTGLPFASELEQKANEADATKQFNREATTGVPVGVGVPGDAPDAAKNYGWILAAIAGYLLLGG